jgi:hypothetical protein
MGKTKIMYNTLDKNTNGNKDNNSNHEFEHAAHSFQNHPCYHQYRRVLLRLS